MDLLTGSLAFAVIAIVVVFFLITQRPVNRIVAYLAMTPEALQKVTRAVEDALRGEDYGDLPDAVIEWELEEKAKHAVAATFAAIYAGEPFSVQKAQPFLPGEDWPKVRAIVKGDAALVSVDLGHSAMGLHARPKAIAVRIKRGTVVKLDNRRPIAEAHGELYTPPPKQAAAASAAKPAPRSAPTPAKPKRAAK